MIDAMKRALEALEGWDNYGDWVWPETALEQCKRNTKESLAALRQAIEKAEKQEATIENNSQDWAKIDGAAAWHLIERHANNWADVGKMMDEYVAAKLAKPEQEPVAYRKEAHGMWFYIENKPSPPNDDYEPLYTAPPPRKEWVGLTDEEIAEGVKQSWVTEQAFQSAVWWAEAKLREKNT